MRFIYRNASVRDIIIILRYNRFVCIRQAFRRSREYKGRSRESITQGCNEKLDLEFFLWLIFKQYSKARKEKFREIQAKYPDKTYVFRSRKELNAFLNEL